MSQQDDATSRERPASEDRRWSHAEPGALAPERALGYADLIRRHSGFRQGAGDSVWSIQGRGGSHNWLRLALAGGALAIWGVAITLYGGSAPTAIGAGIVALIALVNFMAMVLMWLKVVALADWLRRLAEGDLEYRMQFRHKSTLHHLCTALDTLRERSKRVVELQIVERLKAELDARNAALRAAADDVARTEAQIVARQKRAELGTLATGIAAEIGAPIEACAGLAAKARATLGRARDESVRGTALSEEIETNIGQIERHTARAVKIVQAMDALGSESAQRTEVDLNRVVAEQARHQVKAGRGEAKIRLDEDYDPTVGAVEAESTGLARLARNLLSNARHAVLEEAQARRTDGKAYEATITVKTKREGGAVTLEVGDNGTGMDEETRAQAATPFFTTRAPTEGAGLGLSQAESFVRSHAGTLRIESTPGQGTRVSAQIPQSAP